MHKLIGLTLLFLSLASCNESYQELVGDLKSGDHMTVTSGFYRGCKVTVQSFWVTENALNQSYVMVLGHGPCDDSHGHGIEFYLGDAKKD